MAKKAAVTQKEIARLAGISQTVVSFVLNNSYEVAISESTRQRVLQIAKELGYVYPQNLARTYTSNIALVLVSPHAQIMSDPFIPNVMSGITEIGDSQGYQLLARHIHRLADLDKLRAMLKTREIAGLVMNNFYAAREFILSLVDEGYPIILLERDKDLFPDVHSVEINHLGGIHQLIKHLGSLGHQRIACIAYTTGDDAQVRRRLGKLQEMLEESGGRLEERYLRFGSYEAASGYQAMKSLLNERPLPTAVYGMNDLMALGAIRAIHEAGLRIPDDIAVVGYDDMRFSAFTSPAITTIQAPEMEVGKEAAKMLGKLIDGTIVENPHVSLETELMIRESCGG